MIMTRKVIVAFAVFCLSVTTAYASDPGGWWKQSDQGWFFYHGAPPKEKAPGEKPPPLSATPKSDDTRPFSQRMREKGERLLSRALEHPTTENVGAYMEFNKVMLSIADNYAVAWQKVLMEHPDLATGVPEGDSDKDIYYRQTALKNAGTLRALSKRAGLFFFYSSTCPYCRREARYLSQFLAKYPFFAVKAVSIDGGALPEFSDTVTDNGIAERLGVRTVPAIFLAFPPNSFARISTGILNAEGIERSLVLYDQKIDTDYSGAVRRP
jgi:conjugal transfer pilus assembly protein TraF